MPNSAQRVAQALADRNGMLHRDPSAGGFWGSTYPEGWDERTWTDTPELSQLAVPHPGSLSPFMPNYDGIDNEVPAIDAAPSRDRNVYFSTLPPDHLGNTNRQPNDQVDFVRGLQQINAAESSGRLSQRDANALRNKLQGRYMRPHGEQRTTY